MNSQQCWKAKFESVLFSRVQFDEITVCGSTRCFFPTYSFFLNLHTHTARAFQVIQSYQSPPYRHQLTLLSSFRSRARWHRRSTQQQQVLSNTNPPLFLSVFALVHLAEVKKDVLCRNTDDVISTHTTLFSTFIRQQFYLRLCDNSICVRRIYTISW